MSFQRQIRIKQLSRSCGRNGIRLSRNVSHWPRLSFKFTTKWYSNDRSALRSTDVGIQQEEPFGKHRVQCFNRSMGFFTHFHREFDQNNYIYFHSTLASNETFQRNATQWRQKGFSESVCPNMEFVNWYCLQSQCGRVSTLKSIVHTSENASIPRTRSSRSRVNFQVGDLLALCINKQ